MKREFPLEEPLAERCPTTRAFLHSSTQIKFMNYVCVRFPSLSMKLKINFLGSQCLCLVMEAINNIPTVIPPRRLLCSHFSATVSFWDNKHDRQTAWHGELYTCIQIRTKGKGKAMPLWAWQALRVPGGWGSQISRQSAHEVGKAVSPMHRPPLHPRKYSRHSFLLEAESTPVPWCSWRIMSMTPLGIEPTLKAKET
jgi:hypothetical protein